MATNASKVAAACASAADELRTSRALIDALDAEGAALRSRLELEKQRSHLLGEIAELRKGEAAALREALAAKDSALAAKDLALSSQQRLIAELKPKRSTLLKRLGDAAVGAALTLLIR